MNDDDSFDYEDEGDVWLESTLASVFLFGISLGLVFGVAIVAIAWFLL